MAHYAKVINGIVENVISAEQEFIDSGLAGNPSEWIKTSYNTRGNIHYKGDITGETSLQIPDDEPPLRGNYAMIGGHYDVINDVFYDPQPYDSWALNTETWLWEAPVAYPIDGNQYTWDEDSISWKIIEIN